MVKTQKQTRLNFGKWFCKQEGSTEWAFHSWRRKLAGQQPQKSVTPKTTPDNPAFIKVPVMHPKEHLSYAVWLRAPNYVILTRLSISGMFLNVSARIRIARLPN